METNVTQTILSQLELFSNNLGIGRNGNYENYVGDNFNLKYPQNNIFNPNVHNFYEGMDFVSPNHIMNNSYFNTYNRGWENYKIFIGLVIQILIRTIM